MTLNSVYADYPRFDRLGSDVAPIAPPVSIPGLMFLDRVFTNLISQGHLPAFRSLSRLTPPSHLEQTDLSNRRPLQGFLVHMNPQTRAVQCRRPAAPAKGDVLFRQSFANEVAVIRAFHVAQMSNCGGE